MIKTNELKRNLTMTVLLILMVIFMASAVLAVPTVKAETVHSFDGSLENEDSIMLLSFPISSHAYVANNGLKYNVSLDARDSMFGDDILIKYNTAYGEVITFKIDVTFYFTAGDGGSKVSGWTSTNKSGSQLLNSGRTSVNRMVCMWTVFQGGNTIDARTVTFYN